MLSRNGAMFLLTVLCLGASTALAAAGAPDVAAVWVQKEVKFRYVGFTTRYSCDGLRSRVRDILLQLGARDDLQVTGFGCLGVNAPETTPGVRILMHVLQPAAATDGQTVASHWKTIDVFADHTPVDAAADCELIAQLHRDVLPLFETRQVDYSATCSANQPLIGGTRLKADVLVAEAAPRVAATR